MKFREATATPDPKILAQALTTIVVFLVSWLGIELPAEVAFAISVVVGFGLGYVIRPAEVVPDQPGPDPVVEAVMPYKPSQRAAIAAKMKRQGKSEEEISKFFREHGHEESTKDKAKKAMRRGEK